MEGGTFQEPDVGELLRQFELIEIYTDRLPAEAEYAALQKELTGYNANPTYLVLDSENHLEVARSSFTNSKADFKEFLREGLADRPAFVSRVRIAGLTIEEGGEEKVVLRSRGPLVSDDGTAGRFMGRPVTEYRGAFAGSQTFEVGSGLEPGEYVVTVQLVTGLYAGDEREETIALSERIRFQVR